ncbi:MAG TPA: CerR family C-terminal domain-containing protein, partial [Smithella sp.]|nr:CerR family C-terminal domain-containing protein [Smithella sp.]
MKAKRTDSKTAAAILEAAGKIFAANGFGGSTVREICREAGVNLAAVNYHFGSKEGLYLAVLKRFQKESSVADVSDPDLYQVKNPEEQLKIYIRSFLTRIMDESPPAWFGRLLAREFTEPTWAFDVLVEETIRPRFERLNEIVAAIAGKRVQDPSVRKSSMSIIGQCLYFRHARPVISRLYPGEVFGPKQIDALTEH